MQKEELMCYESDASKIKGRAKQVVFPKTISEAQYYVKTLNRICVRGGGTGIRGGAVPEQGQDTVLDLSQVTNIKNIDLDRKTVEVEAGVILDDLLDYLKKFNLEFPIKPLSYRSATIGGMVATNASDSRIFGYGTMQQWVRWIEVIDSDGNIDRKGKTEMSDYAGMEGITGIIINICLNLAAPKKRTASLIAMDNTQDIIKRVMEIKQTKEVSMVDFFDKQTSAGIGLEQKYHLIVEYENDSGNLRDNAYQELMEKKDNAYSFLVEEGYTLVEDIKIMVNKFPEVLSFLEARHIPVYGNVGVGLLFPHFYKGQEKHIPELLTFVKKLGGHVNGRHGIGIMKKQYLEFNDKKILENIKKRTDPRQKFNIGKVI